MFLNRLILIAFIFFSSQPLTLAASKNPLAWSYVESVNNLGFKTRHFLEIYPDHLNVSGVLVKNPFFQTLLKTKATQDVFFVKKIKPIRTGCVAGTYFRIVKVEKLKREEKGCISDPDFHQLVNQFELLKNRAIRQY